MSRSSPNGVPPLVRSNTSPDTSSLRADRWKYESLQHPSKPPTQQAAKKGGHLPHLSIPAAYPTPPATSDQTSSSSSSSNNNHRPNSANSNLTPTASLILDTLQLPISTLLQLVPPNLLDHTHERLSSSALQLPVTSVEAILEACRAMNWICATMGQNASPEEDHEIPHKDSAKPSLDGHDKSVKTLAAVESGETPTASTDSAASSSKAPAESRGAPLPPSKHTVFNPREIVQRAADVVSGLAASRHVDLVIVSSNKGKQRETVERTEDDDPTGSVLPSSVADTLGGLTRGDQGALRFALIFVLSRIVEASPIGSVIRLSVSQDVIEDVSAATTVDETMRYTFRIESSDPTGSKVPHAEHCSSILAPLGISFDQSTPERNSAAYTIGISLVALPPNESRPTAMAPGEPDSAFASEPTTSELVTFVQNHLERRRAVLHARRHSVLGGQVRRWLNEWGCDVARIAIEDAEEEEGNTQPSEEDGWYLADAATEDAGSPVDGHTAASPTAVSQKPSQLGTPRMAVAWSHDKPSLVSYPSDRPAPVDVKEEDTAVEPGSSPSAEHPEAAQQWSTGLGVGEAVLHPVTGVPVLGPADDSARPAPSSSPPSGKSPKARQQASAPPTPQTAKSGDSPPQLTPFNFVIIDDDLQTLQRELLRLRSAVPLLQSALDEDQDEAHAGNTDGAEESASAKAPGKNVRMSLPHRSKSSPQIERILGNEGLPAQNKDAATKSAAIANGATASEAKGVVASEDKTTYAIVYLTSLRNFRLVQDVVQPIIDSAMSIGVGEAAKAVKLPEILVVPKPLGPRRLLTTLYSVFCDTPLEGSFRPIACASPTSFERTLSAEQIQSRHRSITNASSGSQSQKQNQSSPATSSASKATRISRLAVTTRSEASGSSSGKAAAAVVSGSRSSPNKPQSIRLPPSATENRNQSFGALGSTTSSGRHSKPSSPAALPVDAIEYFTETASRIGGSASSGMVIQSPDGRPAGIFFRPQPKSHGSKRSSDTDGERHVHPSSAGKTGSGLSGPRRQTSRSSGLGSEGREQSGIMHVLAQHLDKSGSSGEDLSDATQSKPHQATRSVSATSETSAMTAVSSLKSYPAGSIFSPQVDIQTVLSDRSRAPPIATPLPRRGDDEQNEWIHPLPPSSVRPPPSADQGPKEDVDTSTLSSEALKAHDALPADELPIFTEADKKTIDSVPEDLSRDPLPKGDVQDDASLSPRTTLQPRTESVTKTGGAEDKRLLTVPQSPVQARQSFATATAAMTQPASRRPSAMPQAGVLIGAGFAKSGRKGTGPKKAPVREAVLPPIKVLIVEDNPINQRILTQFMKRKKIQYAIAKDGREAVNQWQTGGFHLILMDIQLPVMDGIEATKEIRKLEHCSNIGILPSTPPATSISSKRELTGSTGTDGGNLNSPGSATTSVSSPMPTPFRPSVIIVALTASVFHSDRVAALAAGCNDFLTKPVNLTWLEKKIIEWGSMQYILLSGFSDHWSGSSAVDSSAASGRLGGGVATQRTGAPHAGQGALVAAANSREIRQAFGTAPDVRARALADRLQIVPSRKSRAAAVANQVSAAKTPTADPSGPSTSRAEGAETDSRPGA